MFCKICGTENVSQAMFCENCGAKFEESTSFESPEATTAVEANLGYNEPAEEEIYEYEEEPPKKSKSVKALVILIIVLAMLVCGAVGVLIAMNLSGGTIEIFGGSSSTSQQSDTNDEEDKEDEEEKAEQAESESVVEDVLKAIENENPSVVEENLGFECGDGEALAEKMAKTIADEFSCGYDGLIEPCEKVMKEYFSGMETHIKDSEKVSGDYIITVSFTRLDKEKIFRNVLDFDADSFIEKLEGEYAEDTELTLYEIEEKIEDALIEKITEIIEEGLSEAELIKDELEFLVADDDGEWFIYTDECDFEVLEKELTLEE